MPTTKHFIAIDLGASGGRVVDAAFDGTRIVLSELHRFEHHPVFVPHSNDEGKYCWDCYWVWSNIMLGLQRASKQILVDRGSEISSIAIDSWGVDYGLITSSGTLASSPAAYRDPRTKRAFDQITGKYGKEKLYARTGVTPMSINTLHQLATDAKDPDQPLLRTHAMLMTPALYAYWLTGEVHAEHTLASTTQLYDVDSKSWIDAYCDQCGIPRQILPETLQPGELIGTIQPSIAEQTGLPAATPVVTTGSHDSACAVLAAPLGGPATRAYLSSGTWSLLGIELSQPCRRPDALHAGFTNEAGFLGTTRFHKNLTGLWLLQECRLAWNAEGHAFTYTELEELAADEPPTRSIFDVNAPELTAPCDMPAEIARQCQKQGLQVPTTPGAMARAIYESLAHEYARTLEQVEQITGSTIGSIAVVGGGSRSRLLNAQTANITGLPIEAGSPEATSMGNVLGQLMYAGLASDLKQFRAIASASHAPHRFDPADTPD